MKVKVTWDKPIDLSPLVDELHEVFGEELLKGAIDSTPVGIGEHGGTTARSWHKTRTDEHTTNITNDSYVGSYQVLSLLHDGTKPHVVGRFNWHAAGGVPIVPGLKVHINPDRIALHAVQSDRGLPEDMPKGEKRRYWQAVSFYSYKENLTTAILERTELACRRLNK